MDRGGDQRKKIIHLVKELILGETAEVNEIPDVFRDYILQEYGLNDKPNPEIISDSELNEFADKIEELITVKYETKRVKSDEFELTDSTTPNQNFMKACNLFMDGKNEYLQISLKLISLLNEITQVRENYCEHLKRKCLIKQDEVEVLQKKLQILKCQSLLKLYSENNAFDAHCRLREILAEKLKSLEKQYKELIELNNNYNELKNNKTYCDMLVAYKQLLRKEKKIDYMIEK